MSAHLFALYYPHDLAIDHTRSYELTDEVVVRRIMHVLRLRIGKSLQLFNRTHNSSLIIRAVGKKSLSCEVLSVAKNEVLRPHITLLLPLLKKDALSQAVYSAVELGASEIQLIVTEKSRQSLLSGELERLERVIIAAAEQSKYFNFPSVCVPITYEKAIGAQSDHKLFFDPHGDNIREFFARSHIQQTQMVSLLIGPEGDLTEDEKQSAQNADWSFCVLTPTVLRSVQAVAIAVGMVRTFVQSTNSTLSP